MSLSKRESLFLGILALMGLMYLMLNFLIQPANMQLLQLQTENEQMVREVEDLEAEIDRSGSSEKTESRETYQQMSAEVPRLPMIPDTIDYLEASAQETQVKLLSISYKEGAEIRDLANTTQPADFNLEAQPVKFRISAYGSHFNLLSLMLSIESAPRLFIIQGMKLTLDKTEGTSTETVANQSTAAVSPPANVLAESPVPESQHYNSGQAILELDFMAFYERQPLPASEQSAHSENDDAYPAEKMAPDKVS